MKNRKLVAVILSLVLILSTVITGCGKSSDSKTEKTEAKNGKYKTIKIGYPSSGADWAGGTLAVADAKGYLNDYLHPLGYEAELTGFVGAAPAIHEALVSGDLDYAYYAGFAGIMANSNGIDTKLISVTNFGSIWQLAVSKDSGIKSLKDLKGKKIAYQRGATPQMYILKVLEEAGLSADDVELLNSTIPEGISSLSSGAVDAAVVSYGQADDLVDAGKAEVLHRGIEADSATYYEPMVLLGRTEFVEDNKDVNVAIIEAMLKAKDDIKADKEAYYKLASEKSGRTLDQIKQVEIDDIDYSYPISLDDEYLKSLKTIAKFEVDNKIIPKNIDVDAWADDTYLKQAVKEYNESTK